MTALLLLMVGCGPRWTEEGAVAPTLAKIDADHDGRVSVEEYQKVTFHADPKEQVDADGNGRLSASELLAHVLATDPASMTVPRSGPQVVRGKKKKETGKAGKAAEQPADLRRVRSEVQWAVKLVLDSIREDVRSVSPNADLPTEDDIKAAARTADLRTAESRAVLARLEAAADAAGRDFPKSLRAAVLANEPVVPTVVMDDVPIDPPPVGMGPLPPGGAGPGRVGPGGVGPGGPMRPQGAGGPPGQGGPMAPPEGVGPPPQGEPKEGG